MEHNSDERSPELMMLNEKPASVIKASVWGMSFTWQLGLAALAGVFIVVLPALPGLLIKAAAADVNHLCGAIIVVVSVISMGEVVRGFRFINIQAALAFAILPWFISPENSTFCITNAIAGAIVAALSIKKGVITEQYGSWNKYIK